MFGILTASRHRGENPLNRALPEEKFFCNYITKVETFFYKNLTQSIKSLNEIIRIPH